MDVGILLASLDPLIGATVQATTWMIKNPLLSIPVLLAEYMALMSIWAAARDQWWGKYYKVAVAIFFYPQDIVVNYFMVVLFLDPPAHIFETVTSRMKRYKRKYPQSDYDGFNLVEKWRLNFAYRMCRILNKFDPTGRHC